MADLLLQSDLRRPARSCLELRDIPAPQDVRVVVSAARGANRATLRDAVRLFGAICNHVGGWGTLGSVGACSGCYHGTGHCMADGDPAAVRGINILVVVEDPLVDYCAATIAHFLTLPNATIIPIARNGGRTAPSPGIWQHIMYRYARVEDVVPEVLLAGQIGEEELAIFVSYQHADSAEVAGQVFQALAEARFAVFLDRFRGTPGQSFMQRIMAELLEKGSLLVLEGVDTHQSPWVRAELATAAVYRLGIIKINLPGSPDLLPADRVLTLAGTPVTPATSLTKPDIDAIVALVRAEIAILGARRRAQHPGSRAARRDTSDAQRRDDGPPDAIAQRATAGFRGRLVRPPARRRALSRRGREAARGDARDIRPARAAVAGRRRRHRLAGADRRGPCGRRGSDRPRNHADGEGTTTDHRRPLHAFAIYAGEKEARDINVWVAAAEGCEAPCSPPTVWSFRRHFCRSPPSSRMQSHGDPAPAHPTVRSRTIDGSDPDGSACTVRCRAEMLSPARSLRHSAARSSTIPVCSTPSSGSRLPVTTRTISFGAHGRT